MVMTMQMLGRTETTLGLGFYGAPGGVSSFHMQFGTRADLENCISQIITGIGAGGTYDLECLNRAQTYYCRVRAVVSGVAQEWSRIYGFTTLAGTDPASPTGVLVQPALIMVPKPIVSWAGANSVAGFPPESMGRPHPFAGWRANISGPGGIFVLYVETNYDPIDTIAFLGTNMPEAGVISVFAGDDVGMVDGSGSLTPSFSIGPYSRASAGLPGRPGYHTLIRLASPISYRYIGVIISGGAPGDMIHITHALFGKARVIKNYSELTETPYDLGSADRLRDGSPDMVSGFRGKRTDFTISTMNETLHQTLVGDLGWQAGSTDPVFIAPNTLPGRFLHDRLLYGNMTAGRVSVNRNLYERTFSIESIIN